MADVFLSYSRADAARIEALVSAIEAHGLTVWWDRSLEQGADFVKLIRAEIDASKACLVCWSSAAAESQWVRAEADEAAHQNKYVGALIAPGRAPLPFNMTNHANLQQWSGSADDVGFLKMLADIGQRVGRADISELASIRQREIEATEARQRAQEEAARLKAEQERLAAERAKEEAANAVEREKDAALRKEEYDRRYYIELCERFSKECEDFETKCTYSFSIKIATYAIGALCAVFAAWVAWNIGLASFGLFQSILERFMSFLGGFIGIIAFAGAAFIAFWAFMFAVTLPMMFAGEVEEHRLRKRCIADHRIRQDRAIADDQSSTAELLRIKELYGAKTGEWYRSRVLEYKRCHPHSYPYETYEEYLKGVIGSRAYFQTGADKDNFASAADWHHPLLSS